MFRLRLTPTTSHSQSQGENERRQALPGRLLAFLYAGLLALALVATAWALYARLDFFRNSVGQRLDYPFFQPGSEGLILSEAAIIRSGGSIYTPFRADSFISAPYPPLYYYLTAWFWPGSGSGFEGGRIISLVSALAAAMLVAILVYLSVPAGSYSKWYKAALIVISVQAGLLFLTLPAVTVWAARVRADMLMTALQLAGLVLVALANRTGRGWLAFLAIIPFALAFYTKQTALAGPFAALLFLAWLNGRRWRLTLAWAAGLALAVGLPFLLLNLATGGELYRRLFKYHNLPWLYHNFETYFTLFYQENFALLLLSAALVVLGLVFLIKNRRSKIKNQNLGSLRSLIFDFRSSILILLYLLASLGLLLGLGVAGADHNHFLPAEVATCAAAGILAGRVILWPGGWRWLALVAVAGLWAQASFFSVPAARYEIELRPRDLDYQRQMSRIIAYAAGHPGPILTSEAGFFVLTGKTNQPDYYNDLFTLAALNQQGLYSQEGLLDRIRRKEFVMVLAEGDLFSDQVRPDVWTPELRAVLEANYYRKFSDVWYIYEPKPSDT